MTHEQFKIGEQFVCGDSVWLCTDKGTRVIVAVRLDDARDRRFVPVTFSGPPYDVQEVVFDEYDMPGCRRA